MVQKDNDRIEREVEMLGEIAISNLDGKTYQAVVEEMGLRDSQASYVQFNQRIGTQEGKDAAREAQAWWGANQQRFYESMDRTTFENEREALQLELFPANGKGLGYASSYNQALQGVMATIDQNFYASFSAKNKEFKMQGAMDALSGHINSSDADAFNAHKNSLVDMKIWTGTEITEITNKSFTQSFAMAETVQQVDEQFEMYTKLKSGSGKMFDIPSNALLAITERDRAYARLASKERTDRSLTNAREDDAKKAIRNASADLHANGSEVTEEALIEIVGQDVFDSLETYDQNIAMSQGRNSSDTLLVASETSNKQYNKLKAQFDALPTSLDKEDLARTLQSNGSITTNQGIAFVDKVLAISKSPANDVLLTKIKNRINSMYVYSDTTMPTTNEEAVAKARANSLYREMEDYYLAELINKDVELDQYEPLMNDKIDELIGQDYYEPTNDANDYWYPNGNRKPPTGVGVVSGTSTPTNSVTSANGNLINYNTTGGPSSTPPDDDD
jgi:polyhydroxyalkanoate synthesis regulator phasin